MFMSIIFAIFACTLSITLVHSHRTSLTFDYGWRFQLGDPDSSQPPLTTSSLDPTFVHNISGHDCSQLAWSQLGRMAPNDCRGACSATPGCLMWQFKLPRRGCFIHDGTLGRKPSCTLPPANNRSDNIGGARDRVPPPVQMRSGVDWKERDFNDSAWEVVDIPHDFVLLQPYSQTADGHHGYIPRDKAGWYRKTFRLPNKLRSDTEGSAMWLHFEGVFQMADVFVNGEWVLRHSSGYLGFDVRLDSVSSIRYVHPKGDMHYDCRGNEKAGEPTNTIAIRVDASFGSGHWYEGGGLQRRVHLYHTPGPVRLVTDGIFAQTESSVISVGKATAHSTAEVVNESPAAVEVLLLSTIFDVVDDSSALMDASKRIALSQNLSEPVRILPNTTVTIGAITTVDNPKLWSIQVPNLYILGVEVIVDGKIIDSVNTTIGFRTIDWADTTNGFKLNSQPIHIRGFSHHSDFGAVGGAVPDRVNLFRAMALRSVGGNTWRTSHNPYRTAVYDILDATGILVWDENRDFNQLNVKDMENLVRRDRNHPSVVIWSACNEIECHVTGPANITGRLMLEATKRWDTTRPFSANLNQLNSESQLNSTLDYLAVHLDVEGFSHGSIVKPEEKIIHDANPEKLVISSECCSCQSQRSEDFFNSTLGLTYPHTLSQAECMQRCMNYSYPYWINNPSPQSGVIAGTLGVWTLFDYGGEPGPWPLVSSSFGQFDIAGFPKSASYWYRALWLAAINASTDSGRPPLPDTHVIRISQAWEPLLHTPPSPPSGCNITKWQGYCNTNKQYSECMSCCKSHAKQLVNMGCKGPEVWPNYCQGIYNSDSRDVQVFTDLPFVQLFLNGKPVASNPQPNPLLGLGFVHFPAVKYKPGNLTAVGYVTVSEQLSPIAVHTILTASSPTAVVLSLDAPSDLTGTGTKLFLDGHDAALVRATVVDSEGKTVHAADNLIEFEVISGPGKIIGVHNGDAKSHELQASDRRHAYHGLARAVVRVTVDASASNDTLQLLQEIHLPGNDGIQVKSTHIASNIELVARAPGLSPGRINIPVSTDIKHSVIAVAIATALDSSKTLEFD